MLIMGRIFRAIHQTIASCHFSSITFSHSATLGQFLPVIVALCQLPGFRIIPLGGLCACLDVAVTLSQIHPQRPSLVITDTGDSNPMSDYL